MPQNTPSQIKYKKPFGSEQEYHTVSVEDGRIEYKDENGSVLVREIFSQNKIITQVHLNQNGYKHGMMTRFDPLKENQVKEQIKFMNGFIVS